jgi:[glutamine synthetase] adenylyltransferase / [glutamine synthetase]-adenylyl-L-tyrosine phosphorylase
MLADSLFRESLKSAGDPALAETEWGDLRPHLSEAALRTDGLRFLLALLGNSRFLVQGILRDPNPSAAIDALVLSPHLLKPKAASEMFDELKTLQQREFHGDLLSAQKILRVYKYREVARIAARDLCGLAPFEEIGRELAALAAAEAEIALRMAVGIVGRSHIPFVVMALGKFGGEDLNFSSDIDLLYVHGRPPEAESGSRTVFEHFCRLSETLTRLLHERTGDGLVFRVDLDLRPEGKSGVIVNSLDGLIAYYEISGAMWERAALTKARPVAGDAPLGRDVLAQLEPFVYPRLIDASAVDGLKRMKAKINDELIKSKKKGFDVKLGPGGIREVEFFVKAFQLIYGGRQPDLRERNTLAALRLLADRGLVPKEDAALIEDAYVFLRRIENRLQMEDERQTHRLPTEAAERKVLARRMGFPEADPFEEALQKKTAFVAACFERLAS